MPWVMTQLLPSPGWCEKYCSQHVCVCVSVSLSVRSDISNTHMAKHHAIASTY